jgi:adenylate cyclase
VLFTDLESSTAVTQRLGDERAQELLRSHNRAVREALSSNSGREVKHTGDGIMASFASPVAAVTAALQIQAALAEAGVRVRIGINAGEPIAEEDDLFGTVVQLAARITDRAEPGQVLVSNVIRELCAGKGFVFEDAGEQTLKGFEEPVSLFAARSPD